MSVFPKAIFLKGEVTKDREFIDILQKDGGNPKNFEELSTYLKKLGIDTRAGQLFFYGESDDDKFTVIITHGIDAYTSINITNSSKDISDFIFKKEQHHE